MKTVSPSAQRRSARQAAIHCRPDQRPCHAQRPAALTVAIDLPMPPSVNSLYFNVPGRGRVKTPRYRQWRAAAVLAGSLARPCRIEGRADVALHLPDGRGDTDGYAKALIDACVEIGIIADDGPKHIRNVLAYRCGVGGMARVVFTRVDGGVRA